MSLGKPTRDRYSFQAGGSSPIFWYAYRVVFPSLAYFLLFISSGSAINFACVMVEYLVFLIPHAISCKGESPGGVGSAMVGATNKQNRAAACTGPVYIRAGAFQDG